MTVSVMGDIINAGIDPHRWFAGVRKGLIDASTDFTKDPKACAEMEKFLEENITKAERQAAKAGNFKKSPERPTGNGRLYYTR